MLFISSWPQCVKSTCSSMLDKHSIDVLLLWKLVLESQTLKDNLWAPGSPATSNTILLFHEWIAKFMGKNLYFWSAERFLKMSLEMLNGIWSSKRYLIYWRYMELCTQHYILANGLTPSRDTTTSAGEMITKSLSWIFICTDGTETGTKWFIWIYM